MTDAGGVGTHTPVTLAPIRANIAGASLLVGGIVYLLAESVAAHAWIEPVYSYADDHISDLGIPGLSPWSSVMNTGLLIEGTLCVLAFVVIAGALHVAHGRHLPRGLVMAMAALAHGVGGITVALVHASRHGTPFLHGVGAALAIVGGGVLLISAGWVREAPRWYRSASVVAGVVGLVSFALFVTDVGHAGDGALERASAYTVIGWEIVTGLLVLVLVHTRANEAMLRPQLG